MKPFLSNATRRGRRHFQATVELQGVQAGKSVRMARRNDGTPPGLPVS